MIWPRQQVAYETLSERVATQAEQGAWCPYSAYCYCHIIIIITIIITNVITYWVGSYSMWRMPPFGPQSPLQRGLAAWMERKREEEEERRRKYQSFNFPFSSWWLIGVPLCIHSQGRLRVRRWGWHEQRHAGGGDASTEGHGRHLPRSSWGRTAAGGFTGRHFQRRERYLTSATFSLLPFGTYILGQKKNTPQEDTNAN